MGFGGYVHTWGGTCDETEPEEGGGGGGTGPDPEPDPEDLSLASCSRDEDTAVDGWGEPGPNPIDAPDVEICSGTGSESCLKGSPGIWVGSWRITEIWNAPVNARHTATARSTSTTVWITELLGPMPLSRWLELELHIDQPTPYCDGISGYRWVKVAGSSATAAYQIGVQNAREHYESDVYWASSNRFVSRILKASGIRPTAAMFDAIGFAPGIKSCFYW